MRVLVFSLIVFLFASTASAQGGYLYGQKKTPLIDYRQWKSSGWHFAPGITYQLTRFSNPEEQVTVGDAPQTITVDPAGKLGAYLEVGRYNIFYEGGYIFNYMDYSLAYKMLRGKEEYTGDLEGSGKYSHNFLLGNFNINNVIQLSSYTFLQNSLGANLDWRFITKSEYNGNALANNVPSKITGQIHYKIGFGFKATNRLFIIPQLEVPILNVHNFEKFKSTWGVFNSRYRPLILSVRFAFLRPANGMDCVPVEDPTGAESQKNFQMR